MLTVGITGRRQEPEIVTEQGVLHIGVLRDVPSMLWHAIRQAVLLSLLLTSNTVPDTDDAQHAVRSQLLHHDGLPCVAASAGTGIKMAQRPVTIASVHHLPSILLTSVPPLPPPPLPGPRRREANL